LPDSSSPPDARATYSYREAGVDIDAGERAVDLFKERLRTTHRAEVVGGVGGFAGLFSLGRSKWRKTGPMLVASTDGVGTKVLLAQQMGIHDTVGIDLVAMSANDVAVQGAEPLFFLDYIVTGKVVPEIIDQIVAGVVEGCRMAGCALLGGEVAEHPGHMVDDSYDLAGFCVGAVDEGKLLTGASMVPGDVVIGFDSSGIHSNGFSLVRKVMKDSVISLEDTPAEIGVPLGEELLRPTLIYWPAVAAVQSESLARGFAHITGGGLAHNLGRIIPPGSHAIIDRSTWEVPNIFRLIQSEGVPEDEMFRTFNMGIGMVAVVVADKAARVLELIYDVGYSARQIGVIEVRADGSPAVTLV
jgi:phosphoribosylformylglycinamidine cyclo-ligase